MTNRMQVANEIGTILLRAGVQEDAVSHIWDRLVDGLARDSGQELAILYGLIRPDEFTTVFIKDGKITSPKEPGAVAYRKV
jgi:hypothetical protein